jgi:hypothetical protein
VINAIIDNVLDTSAGSSDVPKVTFNPGITVELLAAIA